VNLPLPTTHLENDAVERTEGHTCEDVHDISHVRTALVMPRDDLSEIVREQPLGEPETISLPLSSASLHGHTFETVAYPPNQEEGLVQDTGEDNGGETLAITVDLRPYEHVPPLPWGEEYSGEAIRWGSDEDILVIGPQPVATSGSWFCGLPEDDTTSAIVVGEEVPRDTDECLRSPAMGASGEDAGSGDVADGPLTSPTQVVLTRREVRALERARSTDQMTSHQDPGGENIPMDPVPAEDSPPTVEAPEEQAVEIVRDSFWLLGDVVDLADAFDRHLLALAPRAGGALGQRYSQGGDRLVSALLRPVEALGASEDPGDSARQLIYVGSELYRAGMEEADLPYVGHALTRAARDAYTGEWNTLLGSSWTALHGWIVGNLLEGAGNVRVAAEFHR
jgi:hypothetical protein